MPRCSRGARRWLDTAGGAAGAKAALDAYWRRVSRAAAFSAFRACQWIGCSAGGRLTNSPGYLEFDQMTRLFRLTPKAT